MGVFCPCFLEVEVQGICYNEDAACFWFWVLWGFVLGVGVFVFFFFCIEIEFASF